MVEHKGKIVTPTEFAGKESLAEEREEYRAVQRSSGDVKKAMAAVKGRKVSGERKASSRH